MPNEIITKLPTQVTGINGEKQAIVLVLAAHRTNEQGETVALTPSQASAALSNAKATLEITEGTEVLGTSTAVLLPNVELNEGETLTLTVDATIVKTTNEQGNAL